MAIKAVLVYVVDKGKVLLIRGKKIYAPHHGKLNGLGGKIEPEDHGDPYAAAERETGQEGGVKPRGLEQIGLIRCSGLMADDWHVYVFIADGYDGTPHCNPDEGEIVWAPIDNLPYDEFLASDQIFLPYVFRRERFEADFQYVDGQIVAHSIISL